MMRRTGVSFLGTFISLGFVLWGAWACESDSSPSRGGDSDSASDSDSDSESDVHVISGATPGVASALLGPGHEGSGKSNCFECHDSFHVNNYEIGDCVSCHGRNEAPLRPAGHTDSNCEACHGSAHPALDIKAVDSCRACHAVAPVESGDCAFRETYDVVVIGGGGGGLAAAAKLAEAGLQTLLVEQHYKAGGCMVTFDRGEYKFEASLHAYDGWGLSYLNALGLQEMVEPLAGEIMYRLVYPDLTFDVPADKNAYREALKETFPAEADAVDALFENFNVMSDFGEMSLAEAVAYHGIEDERVAAIFTVLSGFLAATPEAVPAEEFVGMWESYHQMGYYYFTGGSQAITDALEAKIAAAGGIIKRHTRAESITVENGAVTGITTADGGCYSAEAIISNAAAKATYLSLLGEAHLTAEFADAVKKGEPSPSNLAMVFLGVDADFSEYFPGTHEIFVGDSYRSGASQINEVQCVPEAVDFMLTNYSAVDPTAAPDGKNAIVITADFMDYDCNNVWRFNDSYDSYTDYKQTLAEVMIRRAEAILPGLSSHIEVMEVASPKTVEQFTLNPRGSWAGWAFAEGEGDPLSDFDEPVPGLFTAGAWVGGAGQSVALSTGISAASAAQAYINR